VEGGGLLSEKTGEAMEELLGIEADSNPGKMKESARRGKG